ncbi:diacylglycerol kinase [Actinomyces sp. B33]|uniref:diacylglycerol/lipid kinase family protein n=1 Tax=Actinomyces sp. B33 TaxID=2942131 RepID=UPI00233F9433|nr:diacylglycerol kinase family protein [Actinomyces sp. B33]MDC4233402.1 diacylglycerol kinase [Actinomyces sp. B33]
MVLTAAIWLCVVLVLSFGARFASRTLLAADRRAQRHRDALLVPAPADDPQRGRPRPWVIVNPTKHDDLDSFKRDVNEAAAQCGVPHVHWIETTAEDPGTGQAVRAVALGASVVFASGGDGTVRAVAAGLAGTGVRMGILPAGTGNLLARNLGLPIDDVGDAVRIGLGDSHRGLDLGWLRVDQVDEPSTIPAEGELLRSAYTSARTEDGRRLALPGDLPATDEYAYVVIGGLGFDGETMAATDSDLKKRVGWIAYVIAGLTSIAVKPIRARLTLRSPRAESSGDDGPVLRGEATTSRLPSDQGGGSRSALATPGPEEHTDPADAPTSSDCQSVDSPVARRAEGGSDAVEGDAGADRTPDEVTTESVKTVMFAMCGELPYITLAPQARLDDGLLDVIAVDTQAGLLGWADLSWKILGQGLGLTATNLPVSTGRIAFRQAEGASVTCEDPQVVQVDGDAIGTARTVHARVQRLALDIAVPETPRS